MANIKSQKKRNLTNERRRVRNKDVRTALKTYIKNFNESVKGDDGPAAESALRRAGKELDRAVSKGIIHKNSAANRKSSLARSFNARTF
ncbi:MAG: 30S ribosomal protein S20 [Actinomycetota bacterium]